MEARWLEIIKWFLILPGAKIWRSKQSFNELKLETGFSALVLLPIWTASSVRSFKCRDSYFFCTSSTYVVTLIYRNSLTNCLYPKCNRESASPEAKTWKKPGFYTPPMAGGGMLTKGFQMTGRRTSTTTSLYYAHSELARRGK